MNSKIPVVHLDEPHTSDLIIDATQHNPAVRLAKGTFQRWRRGISGPLILLFLLAPWLKINNAPWLHMDLESRQLHLMGLTFWPDDFLMLLWLAMASAFALFAVATFAGRLWCGFACPQTIWTMMFIWVEEKIEGSRNQRLKAQNGKNKSYIKTLAKHLAWLTISLLTGFTFVAFFESGEGLFKQIITLNISIEVGFWLLFFTALTYINGGWLREQVCLHMCPYSRFQSVMLDEKSLKVSYDTHRGEPRLEKQKNASAHTNNISNSGDCIDCTLCVQVCPVGIDIRQGLQYACIDCGACIDACDEIMKKINKPTGLIRFTNHKTQSWKALFTDRKRLWGYSTLAVLSGAAFILQATFKETLDIHMIRDRGSLYFYNDQGEISNSYILKLHNKSNEPQQLILSLGQDMLEFSRAESSVISVPPLQQISRQVRVHCPTPCGLPNQGSGRTPIQFHFEMNGDIVETKPSSFFAP